MEYQKTLFVGIDIALQKFDAEYIDINSGKYSKKKNKVFKNTPGGLARFIDIVAFIAESNNFTKIKIGYEATNNYGFHLPFYLTEAKKLKAFQLDIYQINPKIIKNARKSFSEMPKTDSCDAYVIAERLKIGKLPPYTRFNPQYLALRFLTRERFNLVKKIVSIKSRFLSLMFIKASGFAQQKIFSNRYGVTSLNLITQYQSVEEIANTDLSELADFIIQHSKNKIQYNIQTAKKIRYLARESYRIDRTMHDSVTYSLLLLFNQIKFYQNEIKTIDKQIEKALKSFRNQCSIMLSIKGIGPVFAAGIIAELGDLNDFSNQSQVAKFAGLIWRIRQSGNFRAEETELTKSGNRYLRYYLVEAAQSLVMHNSDFLPYYRKKYSESTKHHHKRAVLMVARKFIRIIFSLLKHNKLYESPEQKNAVSLIKMSKN